MEPRLIGCVSRLVTTAVDRIASCRYNDSRVDKAQKTAARPAPENEEELYKQVSATYAETKSIKRTAKLVNISEEKARRILFTTGEYTCEQHEKVMSLLKEGKSLDEISAAIGVTRHKIRSYLPYTN